MDEQPVAEVLPGLYRAVLNAVADLEARQRRREAAAIRAEATRIYSRSWNAAAARRLRALRSRADRITNGRPHPKTRYEAVLETIARRVEMERRTA